MSIHSGRTAPFLTLFFTAALAVCTLLFLPAAPAHADASLTFSSATSAYQEIGYDHDAYVTVDFRFTGGTGPVRLVTGIPQTVATGGCDLSADGNYNSGDSATGLTITHDFTVGGVTHTLTQLDDLSGEANVGASVHVYAGAPVTFDLGRRGLLDVTPEAYIYDTTTGPPPFVPYTLLLKKAAAPPAFMSLSPSSVIYPTPSVGTITLTRGAPPSGETVSLLSHNPAVVVPASVFIPAGQMQATFPIATSQVHKDTYVGIKADAGGSSATAILTVKARPEIVFAYSLAGFPIQRFDGTDGYGGQISFSLTGGAGSLSLARDIPKTVSIGSYNLGASFDLSSDVSVSGVPVSRFLTVGGVTQSLTQTLSEYESTSDEADRSFGATFSNTTPLVFDLGVKGRVEVTAVGLSTSYPYPTNPTVFTFTLRAPAPTP